MIDTDKYENHDMIRIAKQLLIEDAPLLLAEVIRLREGITDIANKWGRPSILRGFIQELQELIE